MWAHLGPLVLVAFSFTIAPKFSSVSYTALSSFGIGDTLWGLSTASAIPLLFLWLPALIVRISSKSTQFDRRHANSSLNFQISLFIYISALLAIGAVALAGSLTTLNFGGAWILIVLWFFAMGILGMMSVIFNIQGSIAGKRGNEYRYPIAIRFLK
jgi:uncharacterized Tic20 family protein